MRAVSVFGIFKIGVGPSSSHTMGPWRAAQRFLAYCAGQGGVSNVTHIRVDLYGSLAKTGKGHGAGIAVMIGLSAEDPVTCDISGIRRQTGEIRERRSILLAGKYSIPFNPENDIAFNESKTLDFQPNGMTFSAVTAGGSLA